MTGPAAVSPELQSTLQHIVENVVAGLNCVGAMVATLEPNNTLPVRAYKVEIASFLLEQLEQRLGASLIGPRSVAYLDDKTYKDNLSIRAIKGNRGRPASFIVSDDLYDLFRPVVSRRLSGLAQRATGIKQVIAVPFSLEDEVVGNLFAAARTEFSPRDIAFLTSFSYQAATAIQSQRRLEQARALESVVYDLQASLTDENQAFKIITDAAVERLGYLAAFVAPKIGNTLPVRAYSVNSEAISQEFIDEWQQRLGFEMLGEKAVAYLDRGDYARQLSVRAVHSGQALTSDSLYDLVRPVVPKPPTDLIQKLLGIKQVIAIPFSLEQEAIGNMYVISRRARFSAREQEVLKAFAQQAAISLRNVQLYRKAEERRDIAQRFAKMAFSASANVHTLRNHIGAFRMYAQMVRSHLANPALLELGEGAIERLDRAADILASLHEPWRVEPDTPVDVNVCLRRAITKVIPDPDRLKTSDNISLHLSLAQGLPQFNTSPDMLTEAFKVLIKNALEAIEEKISGNSRGGNIWLESRFNDGWIEVVVRDDGVGIKPENLDRIFELGWSTKATGLGFGMFWTRDYIEGQKGSIKVGSAWQEGTVVRLCLPTAAALPRRKKS